MPSYAEVTKIIEDRFTNLWTATPVAFMNVPSLDYADAARPPLAEEDAPYISTRVQYGDSWALEVGANPVRRTSGNLVVDFYSKKDTGTVTNQTNMDLLVALFEYQKISGVVFREMVVMQSKAFGGWFITPTMIRFHFDR